MLKAVNSDSLKDALVGWMKQEDPRALELLHLDGKVIKNAEPAPAWNRKPKPEEQSEIPTEQQKPKADKALTLVNFMTSDQRLVDQIAVPRDTNEEAAVAAHWAKMDLAGVCITADAAHTTKHNCRCVTIEKGGDYLFVLKGNQPHALAKAEQLLPGSLAAVEPGTRASSREAISAVTTEGLTRPPRSSTMKQRSASPSKARPRSAPYFARRSITSRQGYPG